MVRWLGIENAVLVREEDESSIPKQKGLSWLETSLWRYVTSNESKKRSAAPEDVEQMVREVQDTLSYRGTRFGQKNPVVVLSGPRMPGRSLSSAIFSSCFALPRTLTTFSSSALGRRR